MFTFNKIIYFGNKTKIYQNSTYFFILNEIAPTLFFSNCIEHIHDKIHSQNTSCEKIKHTKNQTSTHRSHS